MNGGPLYRGWSRIICVASGPSLTKQQKALIRAECGRGRWRVIVTNVTWRDVPDADVLFGADLKFWKANALEVSQHFRGERWTADAQATEFFGVTHVAHTLEFDKIAPKPGVIATAGNSGHAIVSLALAFGARDIVLAGYDMQHTGGKLRRATGLLVGGLIHHHGPHALPLGNPDPAALRTWGKRLDGVAPQLAAAGVRVTNCTTSSALTAYPRAELETTLQREPMHESGLTSVVIPTFNHAAHLADAIDSALNQTAPSEVIVVDDGSTDDTVEVMLRYCGDPSNARVRYIRLPHNLGVANARNFGIEAAAGEFVQFLDADDTIERDKLARQIAEFDESVGFVLCDTRIEDVGGRVQLASERYGYAARDMGGWIAPQLEVGNFIPIHAPLIRRAALGADVRFPIDKAPEDWHFLYALAGRVRCRYLPKVLCTYKKRAGGRNSTTPRAAQSRPGAVAPLRLNLGCGDPRAPSWHPMPGFVNLDKALGWTFEQGLRDFVDRSVAGVTISHALMYVAANDWAKVLDEVARVLEPGGVVRITEDDTANPQSRHYPRGWRDAITKTSPAQTREALERAGFTVYDVDAGTTRYPNGSLCQQQHGSPPDVFFVEGVRDATLLLSPHADDESLFAAFTIIRHRPHVAICYPSPADYGETATRLEESRRAVALLGGGPVEQLPGVDLESTAAQLVPKFRELDGRIRPLRVFAPSDDTSHPDHAAVAQAAAIVFGDRLTHFQTYNFAGAVQGAIAKVRVGEPVPFDAGWSERKRAALACYKTQLAHPRARQFFEWDAAEYFAGK